MRDYYIYVYGSNIKFATPLYLEGNWEIAIKEFSITADWQNFRSKDHFFTISVDESPYKVLIHIPSGIYGDVATLNKAITSLISSKREISGIKFETDRSYIRLTVTYPFQIHLSPALQKAWSFKGPILTTRENNVVYERFYVDFRSNLRRLHILSNIKIPYSIVNNSNLPILCTVPIGNSIFRSFQSNFWNSPRYHSVEQDYIEEIKFQFTDENNVILENNFLHSYFFIHLKRRD